MQVRCVKAFGRLMPGDLAEVPDGAAVDPEHFEPAEPAEPDGTGTPAEPAEPAETSLSALDVINGLAAQLPGATPEGM